MDSSITLYGIELWTHIGVPEAERSQEQLILIDLEVFPDIADAALHDDVNKSIDYEALCHDVRLLGRGERKTVEKLAEDIASMTLKKYPTKKVRLSVRKKPIPGVQEVSITIERP